MQPAAPQPLSDLSRFGRLGMGSANAGNLFTAMTDEQAHALFAAAWEAGIRHFDTAPHYGIGLAEERLGAFLREQPREEFYVSTKVGRLLEDLPPDDRRPDDDIFAVTATRRRVADYTPDGVRRSLEDSLVRMGLDRVDGLYIHDPEHLGDGRAADHIDTATPGLVALRDEGLVSRIGLGSEDVAADLHAARAGVIDTLMLPGRWTLLEQPAVPELVEACRTAGIAILATSPFNSGLLASDPPRRDSHYAYGEVPEERLAHAERLAEVCHRHGVDLPTAALHYAPTDPVCAAVVIGAAEPDQVRQNAARMAAEVPDALWQELRAEGLIP